MAEGDVVHMDELTPAQHAEYARRLVERSRGRTPGAAVALLRLAEAHARRAE